MSVSDELIRQLASRRESPALDFKEVFYSQEDNAELAKDIMAMANSVRNGESGYLLFGVAEDPAAHFGIIKGFEPPQWATDSNLHEKVKHLLNRVPSFSWSLVSADGCTIGVIEIRAGRRPFFPLKDAKPLKRHMAMHRAGSSTDTASPDEIVAWAREDGNRRATELELEQREQELAVRPRLANGVGTRTGSTKSQEIYVINDGNAIFNVSSARCSWRLREGKWRQWLQRASVRYLAEIPPFVQHLRVPDQTVRAGERVSISFTITLDELDRHVRQYLANSVEGRLDAFSLLGELLFGDVEVECCGLTKGRTGLAKTTIDW